MIRRPTDTSTRVAAARALSHLSHQVPDAAAERIESSCRAPVNGDDRPPSNQRRNRCEDHQYRRGESDRRRHACLTAEMSSPRLTLSPTSMFPLPNAWLNVIA